MNEMQRDRLILDETPMSSLNQLDRETSRAYRAFLDYIEMGSGRSMLKLVDMYQTRTEPVPPSKHLTTIKDWARANNWQGRLSAYLAEQAAAVRLIQTEALLDQTYSVLEMAEKLRAEFNHMLTNFTQSKATRRELINDPRDKTGQTQILAIHYKVNVGDLVGLVTAFGRFNKDLRDLLGGGERNVKVTLPANNGAGGQSVKAYIAVTDEDGKTWAGPDSWDDEPEPD